MKLFERLRLPIREPELWRVESLLNEAADEIERLSKIEQRAKESLDGTRRGPSFTCKEVIRAILHG